MATLAEFTARGAVDALSRHASGTTSLLVCGGGAHNRHLMSRLVALLAEEEAVEIAVAGGNPGIAGPELT